MRHGLLSILLAGTLLLGLVPAGGASADATFTVTSELDLTDTAPGDGVCLADGDVCTLRAALQEANALSGVDTIVVPAGTYTLTIAGSDDDVAAAGDLDITEAVVIAGAGSETTIVDGDALDRVFHVLTNGSVSVAGITVQHGLARYGGGIANEGGDLSLDNVAVRDNEAEDGGGIWNNGTLTAVASQIVANDASDGSGGGISNSDGAVTISDSILDDNEGAVEGGGIISYGGSVSVTGGSVSGNTAFFASGGGIIGYGAAVSLDGVDVIGNDAIGAALGGPGADSGGVGVHDGVLAITNSRIQQNYVFGTGGGIFVDGTEFTLDGGTISGNTARFGGGIYGSGTISNVAITENFVEETFDEGGIGGGVFGGGTLINVTLSGNEVEGGGSAPALGSAIYGSATLINVTIAENAVFSASTPVSPIYATGPFEAVNTIVSDASLLGCAGAPVTSLGHNLDEGTTCGFVAAGDLSGVDPLLGPLADNGGPSPTHALVTGSPAIDAGDNSSCPAADQRGMSRPIDGDGDGAAACDIGAYEVQDVSQPDDTTPPVVMPEVAGELGLNDWYVSDVTVAWSVVDDESNVSETEGCETTTITSDTAGTTLTCSATSTGGTTEQSVTIKRDATAPVITPVADVNVTATSRSGARVDYSAPSFTDALSGSGTTTCTPQSGMRFKLGGTTVTCTATDAAGNAAQATFRVSVTYAWSGFLSPIDPNGTTVRKAGSMIPVKFRLTGASASIRDANAKLTVERLSDGYQPVRNARFTSSGGYQHLWKTTGLKPGQYRLTVDLGDGVTTRTTIVTLR